MKKSRFGLSCDKYRASLRLTEEEMGKEIEKQGYRLGKNPQSNKQPIISQFERISDGDETKRKQHRD